MNQINALTPAQKALISIYREKWRRIVFSTEPIDRSTATTAAKKVYQLLELPEPKIVFAQSPHEVLSQFTSPGQREGDLYQRIERALFREIEETAYSNIDSIIDEYIRRKIEYYGFQGQEIYRFCTRSQLERLNQYGQSEDEFDNPFIVCQPSWGSRAAYFDFCLSVLKCPFNLEKWHCIRSVAESCGWIHTLTELCIICDRPRKFLVDVEGRLHAKGEPAIQFTDGFSVYADCGRVVPTKYGKCRPNTSNQRGY